MSGGGLGPLVPPSFFVEMCLINLDSLTLRFIFVCMCACKNIRMYVCNQRSGSCVPDNVLNTS